MIMRGDMQKIIDQINPVLKNALDKIEALDKRIEELEKAKQPTTAPSRAKKA
jgi:BMFP domain-containing protein YqiC